MTQGIVAAYAEPHRLRGLWDGDVSALLLDESKSRSATVGIGWIG